jgi:hypothetical protein
MKLYVAITSLLLLVAGLDLSLEAQSRPRTVVVTTATPQEQARQVWEQAIAAKGGRVKLHSIRNVNVSAQAEYITHKSKKNTLRRESLMVLPDKKWVWQDFGSDVFGLRVEMYDYGAKRCYILTPEEPYEELRHLSDAYTWEKFGLRDMQAILFMETAWVQPIPSETWKDTFQGQTVDVVKTQVGKERIDYILDGNTHLVVCTILYTRTERVVRW